MDYKQMYINYVDIGRQIKYYRQAKNLTQEQLSEQVGISVHHMSHIETANTKVSLATLLSIANALDISIEKLVSNSITGSTQAKYVHLNEINELLSSCSKQEFQIVKKIIIFTLDLLRNGD